MTPDVNCAFSNLPTTIPAYVIANSDGSYTVILNARHSHERRLRSYYHEMMHIEHGDYDKRNADLIELYSHELK